MKTKLALTLLLLSTQAFAGAYTEIDEPTNLKTLDDAFYASCAMVNSPSYDCYSKAYKVDVALPNWEKQILKVLKFDAKSQDSTLTGAYASKIERKEYVYKRAFRDLFSKVGINNERLTEGVTNAVKETVFTNSDFDVYDAGATWSVRGAEGSHDLVIVVDKKAKEVVIFGAGYSE